MYMYILHARYAVALGHGGLTSSRRWSAVNGSVHTVSQREEDSLAQQTALLRARGELLSYMSEALVQSRVAASFSQFSKNIPKPFHHVHVH